MSQPSRLVRLFGLLFSVTGLLFGVAARADLSKADEIRLAYLLNFPRYVTWSANPERHTFELCIIDNSELSARLATATEGKEIDGRKAQVQAIDTIEKMGSCDVLYIPGDTKISQVERFLNAAAKKPILTVGDEPQFLENGGAIRFVVIEGTVRFEIHLDHVRGAGLDMSSRLLKHAERVVEEDKNHNKGAK